MAGSATVLQPNRPQMATSSAAARIQWAVMAVVGGVNRCRIQGSIDETVERCVLIHRQ